MGYKPMHEFKDHDEYKSQHSVASKPSKHSDVRKDSKIFNECDLVIWGKWKQYYEDPIMLNVETMDDVPLRGQIYNMIGFQDFLIFLTNEGKIYSMGKND